MKKWIVEIYDGNDKLKDYFVIDAESEKEARILARKHPSMKFLFYPQAFFVFDYTNVHQASTMMKYLKANNVEHHDEFIGMVLPKNEKERLSLVKKVNKACKPKFSSKDWK
jgi:hypothetical protein